MFILNIVLLSAKVQVLISGTIKNKPGNIKYTVTVDCIKNRINQIVLITGSNPDAVDELVRPIYKGLRQMWWEYCKVDALRHLRYEGYNSHTKYFENREINRVEAYREYVKAIREEMGREYFMLRC